MRHPIIEVLTENPCYSRGEIARQTGLTSERVRQVLNKASLEAGKKIAWGCASCGSPLSGSEKGGYGFCQKCRQIPVACPECERINMWDQTEFLYRIRRFDHAGFCSLHCARHHRSNHKARLERVVALYNQGYSKNRIRRELGYAMLTVYRLLREAGLH